MNRPLPPGDRGHRSRRSAPGIRTWRDCAGLADWSRNSADREQGLATVARRIATLRHSWPRSRGTAPGLRQGGQDRATKQKSPPRPEPGGPGREEALDATG